MRRRSAAWSVERHKCFVYKRVRFVATTPRARKRKNLAHAGREAAERHVPGYVEEELRGYLECGLLCFGFARAVCMNCRTGFVVAFSCKGRGVCPSCNGRHMAQTAAHLADHIIPPVPVRQWVISVPKRLRGMLADRPRAVAALTKIFLDEIERRLLAASGGTPDAHMPRAARHRYPQPLTAFHATVRTARKKSGFKAGSSRRDESGLERGQAAPRHLHDRAASSPIGSGCCSS
jgi:hypothetical protein